MKEFIFENGYLILTVLSILIEVLILVIKRKPKTLDDFYDILSDTVANSLPLLICSVERPGDGVQKKQKVLDEAKKLVIKKLGRVLSSKEERIFHQFISNRIECILETPTKKEG